MRRALAPGTRRLVCAVNYTEVLIGPLRRGAQEIVERMLVRFGIETITVDMGLAQRAASVRARTDLRLPDAYALATAIHAEHRGGTTCGSRASTTSSYGRTPRCIPGPSALCGEDLGAPAPRTPAAQSTQRAVPPMPRAQCDHGGNEQVGRRDRHQRPLGGVPEEWTFEALGTANARTRKAPMPQEQDPPAGTVGRDPVGEAHIAAVHPPDHARQHRDPWALRARRRRLRAQS